MASNTCRKPRSCCLGRVEGREARPEVGEGLLRLLEPRDRLPGEARVPVEGGVAQPGALALRIGAAVALRLAGHRLADPGEVRVLVGGAGDVAVGLLRRRHLVEGEHVLLALGDGGGEELLRLAGRRVELVVEGPLDGGRPLARGEPGVEADVGEGDRDGGGDHVHGDQQAAPGLGHADEPGHEHEGRLDAERRQEREPGREVEGHALLRRVPGHDREEHARDEEAGDERAAHRGLAGARRLEWHGHGSAATRPPALPRRPRPA